MYEYATTAYDWMAANFESNEVFAGFVGASIIGIGGYYLRFVFSAVWGATSRAFLRHMTVHVEAMNTDEPFHWLSEWINTTTYARRMRRIRVVKKHRSQAEEIKEEIAGDTTNSDEWSFGAGEGRHLFLHGGRPIVFERKLMSESSKGTDVMERITIRTLGRSREPLLRVIEEAREIMGLDDDMIRVYSWASHYWDELTRRSPRTMDSVVMDHDAKRILLEDVRRFRDSREWYSARGIPYHRGYLVSGEPGTGKSSLVTALAHEFDRSLAVLNLGAMMGDREMEKAFYRVPRNGILVLEDIDAAHRSRVVRGTDDGEETREGTTITLSGLLNCLDGLPTPDGLIVVMTTNYPDRLDPAIMRPGRADMHVRLGPLDEGLRKEFFDMFYPNSGIVLDGGTPMTAARLQGICMRYPDDPETARWEILATGPAS